MKEFELCTDDTSTELANGFIFLIFNIIIFFPFAMLFKIDISWFFTIFGVELILISILKLLKMKKISKWNIVNINVLESKISNIQTYSDTGKVECFLPNIQYTYEIDGVLYTSKSIVFDEKSITVLNKNDAGEIISIVENKAQAYYNPMKPEKSVIFNYISKDRKSHYYALAVIGILLIAATIALV